jgi:alanyl-tRNA synthetase
MLGNFSFGSYWKTEAIQLAWAFLTQELGLPADRLSVTVLEGDEDTAGIWRSVIGLPDSKIRRFVGFRKSVMTPRLTRQQHQMRAGR